MPQSGTPTHNGKALVFDPKFAERPLKDQIDYLQKLCASQNHALDLMQKERNDLAGKLQVAEAQLGNADQALAIQKKVVHDLITKTNADAQEVNQRIMELETRVKAQDAVIEGYNGDLD